MIATPVTFPLALAVTSTVNPVPDPEDVVATPVAVVYPVPPTKVPRLSVETPPRLGLVIVKVSPIRYPVPAAFNASPVIAPAASTVVSTVNDDPVPPEVATLPVSYTHLTLPTTPYV